MEKSIALNPHPPETHLQWAVAIEKLEYTVFAKVKFCVLIECNCYSPMYLANNFLFVGGTLTQTLSGSLQTLTSVCFNEGEDLLLGSSMDNSTRIWDLTTGRIRVGIVISNYIVVVFPNAMSI
jgi:WD40 repeat protein